MQKLYIVIGLLTAFSISIFILANMLDYFLSFVDRIRRPLWKEQTTRLYRDLATAFEARDKKVCELFIKLMSNNISDVKSNAWDLRDEFYK